ncbi:CHRD domain-containing protein, partial [Falsiruegeria litorea]|uniref:CHRD domain-containing protein n=1 Tax=Falsiruegeria litorea TaxID=1280831 RepID=UPI001BFDDE97
MAHEPDGVLDNGATPSTAVTLSGVTNIDAQLTGRKWTDYDLTYSFVDLASDISADYALLPSVIAGFSALSAAQETAARYWFDQYASISGLTFTELDGPEGALNEDEEATIRMFNNSNQATAFGYYPGNSAIAGDTYFGGTGDNPARYNFDWVTVGHEIGHTLGMDHGHEGLLLEPDNNSSEYSIMTYLTYVGDPGGINTAGPDNNPQTLMMADIQTIQYNYGANFGFNASNTTYTFSTTTGEMFVNGVGQVAGTGNKIFRTIWDGDGFDTYDLSNYTTDLLIDLRPGMHTDLDVGGNAQRADLDFFGTPNTHMARGHIFNAMQYNNDSRSLIESAIGGSGNDSIVGNDGNNALNGGSGDDTILGGEGNDTITDGLPSGGGASTQGNDIINAGAGNDIVRVNYVFGTGSYNGGADTDTLDIRGDNTAFIGGNAIDLGAASWTSWGSTFSQFEHLTAGSGAHDITGSSGNNQILAGGGNDTIRGEGGIDLLFGQGGIDQVFGGAGNDLIRINTGDDGVGETYDGGADSDTIRVVAIGGGTIFNLRDDTVTSIERLDFTNLFNVSATIEMNASQVTLVGIQATAHVGDTNKLNIFMNGASTLDLSGISISGFTEPGDGVMITGDTMLAQNIIGSMVNDTITGVGGENTIEGGLGNNDMDGGASRNDTASYAGAASGVTVDLGLTTAQNTGGAGTDTLTNFENLLGSAHTDHLTGDNNDNRIEGGLEADTIMGLGGADTLLGGEGDDLIKGGFGADSLDGGLGTGDTLSFEGDQRSITVNMNSARATAVSSTIELANAPTTSAVLAAALVGDIYINVHTGNFPSGELRGQVGPVLSDTTVGLVRTVVFENILLDPANQVPPVASDNVGFATLTMVDNNGAVSYSISTIMDLNVTGITAAHLHEAPPGSNGGVVANILGAGGVVSNSYEEDIAINFENVIGGSTGDFLNGNYASNRLEGRDGSDRLDGGRGGSNTLVGGLGQDEYFIRFAGDTIVEVAGEGTADEVQAFINFALAADDDIEILEAHFSLSSTLTRSLTGNALAQTITGHSGKNTLRDGADGMAGAADTMRGLDGDDTYRVNNSAAVVEENTGEGTDRVITYVNYALGAGQEIERLQTDSTAGTSTRSLQGNELSQYILGNNGRNTLRDGADGMAGAADTMVGLQGDDTYRVNNSGTEVREKVGEGTDRVVTYVNYALGAGQEIERLQTDSTAGTSTRSLQGNELSQYILGNNGRNTLRDGADGMAGAADTMVGLQGDDTYRVNNSGTEVREKVGEGTD